MITTCVAAWRTNRFSTRNDGQFRCPLVAAGLFALHHLDARCAWIICGYAEQLEFLDTVRGTDLDAPSAAAAP